MAHEYLWERKFINLVVPYWGGKEEKFQCDSNIADAILLLNKKGYHTGNCCEGHPYKRVGETNQKRYDNIAYFEGGYISFCSIDDKKYVLSKLNEKCDYFSEDDRPGQMTCVRNSLYWNPFRSMEIDGHKYSTMRYSSMVRIIRMVYEDIWRILLDVAKELPYKESYNEY